MSAAATHKISVGKYYRMAEAGGLQPDERVELLDGQIFDLSPIGPFHAAVTARLDQHFQSIANGRWVSLVQSPVRLNDLSEPLPDLLLVPAPIDTFRHPTPGDVYLLVEVSDSTLAYDQEVKLPVYARSGIAEVWLVNMIVETIEIYRDPSVAGYSSKSELAAGDFASPAKFPDVKLDVAALFKR